MLQVIQGAKDGKIEYLEALTPRILGAYERHSTAILDALLHHLEPLTPSDLSSGIIAMQALCEVNRWHILNPSQSPLTVSTSLRLSSASDDYIDWAHVFIKHTHSLNDEEFVLASYQITTHFFHSLISTPTQIAQTLAGKCAMLDLAVRWWISVYDGSPIMYADGMPNQKATRDSGLAVFRQLTKDDPAGMARAIMDGRVCTPALFVQRTIDRARCLVRLNEMKQLSERRPATLIHVRENFLTLLDTTQRLRESNPALRELFQKARILTVFMEVLGTIRDMPSNSPEDTERSRAAGMLEMLELVLDWVTCTPSGLIGGMLTVIEGGFLMHMGNCVKFAEERDSRCTFVMGLLIAYATYPKLLAAMLTGLSTHVTPKTRLLTPGSARHSYFNGLVTGLEPLRKAIAVENQTRLCDNPKVRFRTQPLTGVEPSPMQSIRTQRMCPRVRACAPVATQ